MASAGVVAVILSAICAMVVPRAIMIAAKIMRLRIYTTPDQTSNIIMSAAKPRLSGQGEGGHFDQKDERRVNGGAAAAHCSKLMRVGINRRSSRSFAGSANGTRRLRNSSSQYKSPSPNAPVQSD